MKTYLSILILFLICSCNVRYDARCKYVCDGDSFYLSNGKEVRLYGIDTPENTRGHNQPFGKEATNFTRRLIQGKKVTLIVKDVDKYNRKVCKVILSNGSDLSLLLVKAGLAFTYPKYSPQSYCNQEILAKIKGIGIWGQKNPLTPYQFRKLQKK